MALLYTCYADQPVIDALVAPFSAPVSGYFSWFLGTATQNSKVPDCCSCAEGNLRNTGREGGGGQEADSDRPADEDPEGAGYGLSGRKPRLPAGNRRVVGHRGGGGPSGPPLLINA